MVTPSICAMVKGRYIEDGHPTLIGNPYNGYIINPYYWVDDHPLLYGNNGSLDPSTYLGISKRCQRSHGNLLEVLIHPNGRTPWPINRGLLTY